uniref:hypothetical protein n=1 Tax=Neobacillus soli TaxID=220688 RepID=UPI0014728A14
PQDIEKIAIAFHLGTSRTRTLDVFNNHYYHSTITSSGKTDGFETFDLYTDETKELKLCVFDPKWNTDVWLSITEVEILVK